MMLIPEMNNQQEGESHSQPKYYILKQIMSDLKPTSLI
jgi:hypothetical protein